MSLEPEKQHKDAICLYTWNIFYKEKKKTTEKMPMRKEKRVWAREIVHDNHEYICILLLLLFDPFNL